MNETMIYQKKKQTNICSFFIWIFYLKIYTKVKYLLIFKNMYDWAWLMDLLKITTNTENSDIPDSTYEKALSQSHAKIVEKIKAEIDSKLFYSEFTTDLEIWKKEYDNLPITTASAIWIKYEEFQADGITPWDYVKARIKDITEVDISLAELEANQSKTHPIFMIADNSIFLYPVATEDVTEGIQARGKLKIPRITITSPESTIFDWKLSEYQEVIVQGAKQMIYEINLDRSSARDAKANFKIDLDVMITEVSSRYDQPVDYEEPNRANFVTNYGGEDPFTRNHIT